MTYYFDRQIIDILEMEELAKHGVMFPPEILGLNEDQVRDFKLVDPWADKCIPSGGYIENK